MHKRKAVHTYMMPMGNYIIDAVASKAQRVHIPVMFLSSRFPTGYLTFVAMPFMMKALQKKDMRTRSLNEDACLLLLYLSWNEVSGSNLTRKGP